MKNGRLKVRASAAIIVVAALCVLTTSTANASAAPNSGTSGSPCQASDLGLPKLAVPAGWSTTKLGPAPGYYEVGPPRSGAPKGVMILIHGGGWFANGPGAAALMRNEAGLWTSNGWEVVSITSSRSCGYWPVDVAWFYDHVSWTWPSLPVCAMGQSAGAHLALLLAGMRPHLACAISEGGPTDLMTLGSQKAYSPTNALGQTLGPALVQGWATAAFTKTQLGNRSPMSYDKTITARVLLGLAATDPFIPQQQSSDFVHALDLAKPLTDHESYVLRAGSSSFVHGNVSSTDLAAFQKRELAVANNTTTLGRL